MVLGYPLNVVVVGAGGFLLLVVGTDCVCGSESGHGAFKCVGEEGTLLLCEVLVDFCLVVERLAI